MDRLTKRDEFGIRGKPMEIKYPKGEVVWVSYRKSDGVTMFILTSKPARDFYFLYEVLADGSLKKLGRARSPTELEDKFGLKSRMRS